MKKQKIIIIVSLLILFFLALTSFLFNSPIKSSMTVEAGTTLSVRDFYKLDFLKNVHLINVRDMNDLENYRTDTPGTVPLQFLVNGKASVCALTVIDTVAPTGDVHDAVIIAGDKCTKKDLVGDINDATSVKISVTGPRAYNTSLAAGLYPVKITLTDAGNNKSEYNNYIYALPVKKNTKIELGSDTIKASQFLKKGGGADFDIQFSDEFNPDDYVNNIGKYTAKLLLTYKKDNKYNATITLPFTVADTKKPKIIGAEDIEIYKGQTVSYRKNVFVRDNQQGEVRLQVDADDVNINKAGKYTVVYKAVDDAGNKASKKITLTVLPASENHTDAVKKYAKETLAKIINDDMSDIEKLRAIFNYCHDTISYTGESDKGNQINAAYNGFKTHTGDCFTYYAIADELLTAAGFDDMMVERDKTGTRHFWNLVKYQGEWYHFDSCPLLKGESFVPFMVNDADLLAFSEDYGKRYPDESHRNYYSFNPDKYPDRAKESLR